jgi:hypothetical protein
VQQIANDGDAERRHSEDHTAKETCSLQGFINKILDQCREVMQRHSDLSIDDYARIGMYRRLEMEMVDVKVIPPLIFERNVEL